MDGDSAAGFAEMAECVVNEYNGFCPLGGDNPCIDGAQTEGENIADNGGTRVLGSRKRDGGLEQHSLDSDGCTNQSIYMYVDNNQYL